jgi:hypothetical protein
LRQFYDAWFDLLAIRRKEHSLEEAAQDFRTRKQIDVVQNFLATGTFFASVCAANFEILTRSQCFMVLLLLSLFSGERTSQENG